MEIFVLAVIITVVAAVVSSFSGSKSSVQGGRVSRVAKMGYRYVRKGSLMTQSERNFYQRLMAVAGDRYYVFPQVHLDSLLDHRVKGQNWKGALSTIQRKSVDYVLCDKQTMQSAYAVELDDSTHDRADRKVRDTMVEQLLADAGLPLVRFRNVGNMTDVEIAQKFAEAVR